MKIKRILCSIFAIMFAMCNFYVPVLAASTEKVEKSENLKFIPIEVINISEENLDARAKRMALGSNSSGNFYNSATVRINIPSSIYSYSANQVGIIIVNRTSGATGDTFKVECTNKPIHNTKNYTVGNTSWTYYDLIGISATGGNSLTFKATWSNGNHFSEQYEFIAGLFYYG